MSSIPRNSENENNVLDFVTSFIAEFHLSKILFKCNAGKEKGIPVRKEENLDVIAMIKKSSEIKYGYQNKNLNIKEIYSRNKKRRGRSRYLLSVEQRRNTDDKTICELFFCLLDELDGITFIQSMRIIVDALMDAVMEYFHITESQLEEFTSNFIQRLPKYMALCNISQR